MSELPISELTNPKLTNPELTLEEAGALAPLVDAQQAASAIAGGAVLIDVRSAAGRAQAGLIPDAVLATKTDLDAQFGLESPSRIHQIHALDQDIVIICGSVRGSGPVAAHLRERGFTNVVHVEGGFPAWKEAGLPTSSPEPLIPESSHA